MDQHPLFDTFPAVTVWLSDMLTSCFSFQPNPLSVCDSPNEVLNTRLYKDLFLAHYHRDADGGTPDASYVLPTNHDSGILKLHMATNV